MSKSSVLSKLNINELALYNAWANQSNGTNWFFYIEDKSENQDDSDDSNEDSIETVISGCHKGFVKMLPMGIGSVIEMSPVYLKALGSKGGELDSEEVLKEQVEGIINSDNPDGGYIIAWSHNKEPFFRGDVEIPRYRGSVELHKDILEDLGYTYFKSDCVLLESNDGVLVPILRKEALGQVKEDMPEFKDMVNALVKGYKEANTKTISL
jgi:hypothetical protein